MSSTYGQYIHNAIFDKAQRYDTSELLEHITYSSMQLLVIFMAVFFFLFVYFCIFGFIVGSIAESTKEASDRTTPKPEDGSEETKS